MSLLAALLGDLISGDDDLDLWEDLDLDLDGDRDGLLLLVMDLRFSTRPPSRKLPRDLYLSGVRLRTGLRL